MGRATVGPVTSTRPSRVPLPGPLVWQRRGSGGGTSTLPTPGGLRPPGEGPSEAEDPLLFAGAIFVQKIRKKEAVATAKVKVGGRF